LINFRVCHHSFRAKKDFFVGRKREVPLILKLMNQPIKIFIFTFFLTFSKKGFRLIDCQFYPPKVKN